MIEISGFSIDEPREVGDAESIDEWIESESEMSLIRIGNRNFEVLPTFTKKVVPEYPELARRAGMEGKVWVKILIRKDGRVLDVVLARSSGVNAGFEEAALKAARKCEFSPAYQDGEPITIWVSFPFKFVLDD